MRQIVIGSRGSRLALRQSESVQREIQKHRSDLAVHIEVIKTSGDKISHAALTKIGSTKGLFVKEIEEALLQGEIDLAVHSLKDVPTTLPEGLCLGAILKRADARDALVSKRPISSPEEWPEQLKLGTSSLRRSVQLQLLHPDLSIVALRGNVESRLRKAEQPGLDGVVLAAAGLKRLGLETKITYFFSLEEMVPAVGQGVLAVEIRSHDKLFQQLVAPLEHSLTRQCAEAERGFLHRMGGGCQVPMGAHALIQDGQGRFSAFVASPSRKSFIRKVASGKAKELQNMALETADYLLSRGADAFLKELDVLSQV